MRWTLPLLALLGCGSEYGQHVIPPEPPEPPLDTAIPPEPYRASTEQSWEQSYEIGTLHLIAYVDKSGSMDPLINSNAIGDALVALVEAVDPGGPWTLTVMSTTQGGTSWAGPYTSMADREDIHRAPKAISGGYGEQGLGAVYRESGHPGTVHVVFSDEDDQSYAPDPSFSREPHPYLNGFYWTVSEWAAEWSALEAEQLILIVSHNGGCGAETPRYDQAALLTGATVADVCGTWEPTLASFEWPWDDPRDAYTLEHDPIPASVRVYFDGVQQAPSTWALIGRTVHLDQPPQIGATVRITYDYWSL